MLTLMMILNATDQVNASRKYTERRSQHEYLYVLMYFHSRTKYEDFVYVWFFLRISNRALLTELARRSMINYLPSSAVVSFISLLTESVELLRMVLLITDALQNQNFSFTSRSCHSYEYLFALSTTIHCPT